MIFDRLQAPLGQIDRRVSGKGEVYYSGYFFLRVHKTNITQVGNKQSDYTTIEDRVKVLSQLSAEYSPLELPRNVNYSLEIVFIDNAIDKNGVS